MFTNFAPQQLGARNTDAGYTLYVTSTPGGFRMSKKLSILLGVNTGEYVTLLTNYGQLEAAIDSRDESFIAFCQEQGIEPETFEARQLLFKTYGRVAIAKGYPLFTSNGTPILERVRITAKDKITHVVENYDKYLAEAMADDSNLELKERLSNTELTDEDKIAILAEYVTPDETQAYMGSKTAATSKKATGLGNVLNFTDKNTWNILKEDLGETAHEFIREYEVKPENKQTTVVNDGHRDISIDIYVLGEYTDKKPMVRSKAEFEKVAEQAIEDTDAEEIYDEDMDNE